LAQSSLPTLDRTITKPKRLLVVAYYLLVLIDPGDRRVRTRRSSHRLDEDKCASHAAPANSDRMIVMSFGASKPNLTRDPWNPVTQSKTSLILI